MKSLYIHIPFCKSICSYCDFAKMFYNHLGFYGENLKVAKLEQFIEKRGKIAEFRRVFEDKNGSSWLESRDAFAFFEDELYIIKLCLCLIFLSSI